MNQQRLLLRVLCLLCLPLFLFAQGTVTMRETANPEADHPEVNPGEFLSHAGHPTWIKLTFSNISAGSDVLNDDFTGTSFRIDLNVDGDDNATTNPGDVYTVAGNEIKTHWRTGEGLNDEYAYLPIYNPQNYGTDLRPRVQLINSGALRIGESPYRYSITIDADYGKCVDGIKPRLLAAYYYDDGSGHSSEPATGHTNTVAYDGYVDRIDLYWSEPMDPSRAAASLGIFQGLGATISTTEPTGQWNPDSTWNDNKRFTFWVISNQPNTGALMNLVYTQPEDANQRHRNQNPIDGTGALHEAETQAPLLNQYDETINMDKAGPAIVNARTTRVTGMRRQPLAAALDSARILVTFSEVINRNTIQNGTLTFEILITDDSSSPASTPTIAAISLPYSVVRITYPVSGNSRLYELQLDHPFPHEDVTGTIQFQSSGLISDMALSMRNPNGISTAMSPPTAPTDPEVTRGPVVPIDDGIFPNIVEVRTRDVAVPMPTDQLATGGGNGWGYLDYVEVEFDHSMNTSLNSTQGFTVQGTGISGIASTGAWISPYTLRIPLLATSPMLPNTGVIPKIKYSNPGGSTGLRSAVNAGPVENIVYSDTTLSENNFRIVDVLDYAGPALVQAYTAGIRTLRLIFSEQIQVDGLPEWPQDASEAMDRYSTYRKFIWFMNRIGGSIHSHDSDVSVYFTGLSESGLDKIFYLHHTSPYAWNAEHTGAINFLAPGAVMDAAENPNDQYDNDESLWEKIKQGSDISIMPDTVPPKLVQLYTVDLDANGRLDHYKFVFDDTSAIYPKRSFVKENWDIVSYYCKEPKEITGLNPSRFIIQEGDTIGAFIQFKEASDDTLANRPYYGDTGDVPDVIVAAGNGFADWAGNVMDELTLGISVEKDGAGPAITKAKSISTTEVEALVSEDLKDMTVHKDNFLLKMGIDVPLLPYFTLNKATEYPPDMERMFQGRVILRAIDQLYWLPETEGLVKFARRGVVFDDVSDTPEITILDNPNNQNSSVAVNDNIASNFDIDLVLPGNPVRGVPFQVEVIARDAEGKIDRNFPERVNLTSNLQTNEISLPAGSQSLYDGRGLFTLTSWVETEDLMLSVSVENDRLSRYFSSSDPMIVEEAIIDEPDTLIVNDYRGTFGFGDQGGFVVLTYDFSQNHPGIGASNIINFYQIYREIDGMVFHWQTVQAVDPTGTGADSMRVILWTGDNLESNFWVRAVWDPNYRPVTSTAAMTEYEGSAELAVPDGYTLISSANPVLAKAVTEPVRADKQRVATTAGSTSSTALMSGSRMGFGGAHDNIAPVKPERLRIHKEGQAVAMAWGPVYKGVDGSPELFGVKYRVYGHSSKPYFDPETEGELLATTQDTTLTLPSGALRSFFCVRATDSDNESVPSERAAKWGFMTQGDKQTRYNMISFPLETTQLNTVDQLTNHIDGLAASYQLDALTNQYSRFYLHNIGFGSKFQIHTGMPLLVSLNEKNTGSWFYTGILPDKSSQTFDLSTTQKQAFKEVTIPLDRDDIQNARDLAQDIGLEAVEVIYLLDPENNDFSLFYIPGVDYGSNFELRPGDPVLISVNNNAPKTWPVR